ncbi:MAG TPA: VWA domain-containing protein, partial [bacterium]|nr:VWA domain-containing protein [bacterium]
GDDALDQMQTCSEGIWSNKGNCLEPGKYAILEKDAVKTDLSLDFEATPDGTDIALIVDTSGSMMNAISVLQNNISTITSNIRSYISDSQFGVVTLGTLGYNPYLPIQNITSDLTTFNSKVASIPSGNGSYEYHAVTIEQTASGSGTTQTVKTYDGGSDYGVNVSSASCGSGFRGGICFRENSLPLFVLMSDEAFATTGWIWSVGEETTAQDAIDSMNDINAKIAVIDSSGTSKYVETNTATLAAGTYSYDQAGIPFYYNILSTGAELNLKVEDAVKKMYDETEMTTGLVFESPVSNTIEATQFVTSHATVSADPVENIHSKDDLYFYGTLRETMLKYSISLRNTVSTPSQMTFLTLEIKLKWYSITLDTIDFTIVIP